MARNFTISSDLTGAAISEGNYIELSVTRGEKVTKLDASLTDTFYLKVGGKFVEYTLESVMDKGKTQQKRGRKLGKPNSTPAPAPATPKRKRNRRRNSNITSGAQGAVAGAIRR